MKAAVMTGIKQVELMDYPMPPVGDDDVLVQVECCGVCGSDLHYYEFGRIGDLVVEKPMILGHECAGRVVRFGKNVTGLSAGDLVAIEPGYTCGKCEYRMTAPSANMSATRPRSSSNSRRRWTPSRARCSNR